jgi:hypothetical protein
VARESGPRDTKIVEAHWIDATIGEKGRLIIEGLPLPVGEAVEVLVIPKGIGHPTRSKPLPGSVVEYRDPFEPVAVEDWESLR